MNTRRPAQGRPGGGWPPGRGETLTHILMSQSSSAHGPPFSGRPARAPCLFTSRLRGDQALHSCHLCFPGPWARLSLCPASGGRSQGWQPVCPGPHTRHSPDHLDIPSPLQTRPHFSVPSSLSSRSPGSRFQFLSGDPLSPPQVAAGETGHPCKRRPHAHTFHTTAHQIRPSHNNLSLHLNTHFLVREAMSPVPRDTRRSRLMREVLGCWSRSVSGSEGWSHGMACLQESLTNTLVMRALFNTNTAVH